MTEHVTRDYTGNMWLYWNDLAFRTDMDMLDA